MTTARYPEEPASVAKARAFVANALSGATSEVRERAVLITSELATNAIIHAHSSFSVTTSVTADEVRVTVTDTGGEVPQPRRPDPSETHGRGLLIMSKLADEWGIEPGQGSTTVWFTLALVNSAAVSDASA